MSTALTNDRLKQSDFRRFTELIYRESGIFLDTDKQTLLQSRLQKRLRALDISTYSAYFDYLEHSDPEGTELQAMINRVTTNKTHFFREEHHFEHLRDTVFPAIIESANKGERKKRLRIWSAACSSGEEPYSIAMTVQETFQKLAGWDIRILASDIDTDILKEAQSGIYHSEIVEDIDPQQVKKHFLKGSRETADKVMVRPEVQNLVTFRQINFADEEWPIHTTFDIIFCRNVLIYFDEATQDRLVRRFADYLCPDGNLFIGHSESLSRTSDVYQRSGPTVFCLTPSSRKPDDSNIDSSAPAQTTVATVAKSEKPPLQNDVFTDSKRTSIVVGDVVAFDKPTVVSTTLGSCVAACIYDDVSQVGGMNHFALPFDTEGDRLKNSFGVHAMELLINKTLSLGAARHRLKAKIFGAARISTQMEQIGAKNEQFIRDFLATENIAVEAHKMGENTGMYVQFETSTGRARIKMLDAESAENADKQLHNISLPTTDVTLF